MTNVQKLVYMFVLMKREIKFRGLRADGKGWVYGFYYEYNGKSIISSEYHSDDADTYYNDEVIPESVGQFTSFGVDIYEGDILEPISPNLSYVVVFESGQFGLESKLGYWGSLKRYFEMCGKHGWSCKVRGNIHETKH